MSAANRLKIHVALTLDKACSTVVEQRSSYLCLVIQLLGQVQQTKSLPPSNVLLFDEEIMFDAEFEPHWTLADVKSFLQRIQFL